MIDLLLNRQGTSNIPFAWFLVLGCNRQAQELQLTHETQKNGLITACAWMTRFSFIINLWPDGDWCYVTR